MYKIKYNGNQRLPLKKNTTTIYIYIYKPFKVYIFFFKKDNKKNKHKNNK